MAKKTLTTGIPGIDRPFKQKNPNFPPLTNILTLVKSPLIQHMVSRKNNADCSEIAEKLFQNSQQGAIIYYADITFNWPDRLSAFSPEKLSQEINIPEKTSDTIIVSNYCYHAVFSDGRYIYDPALSSEAIVKSDYTKLMKSLNPGRLGSRYTIDNMRFFKGEYNR